MAASWEPAPYDLHAGAAGTDLELFDTNRDGRDPRMRQDECSNSFGQHFDERNMLLGDDHPDQIGDHVVGEHVANILGRMIGAQYLGVDVEAHVLRFVSLMGVGADADRQHEIAHKNSSVSASSLRGE